MTSRSPIRLSNRDYDPFDSYRMGREQDLEVDTGDSSKPTIIQQRSTSGSVANINHYEININISKDTDPEVLKKVLDVIKNTNNESADQQTNKMKKRFKWFD